MKGATCIQYGRSNQSINKFLRWPK